MTTVLRWGRSAYETDDQLAAEREGVEARGWQWSLRADSEPPKRTDVDVLVVNSGVRVDRAVLAGMRPKIVVTTTSGYDHIDLEACRSLGVQAARCPLARRDIVVEHALACLLTLSRRLPTLQGRAADGVWARGELEALAPSALIGAPVAVIGLGVIGTRMAEVLTALGARVLGVDPAGTSAQVELVSLEEALSTASAVTLHCSLTPSSDGLLSAQRLGWLPEGAILVNTARGRLVDVGEAIARTRSGQLAGVALDVFPTEPWPYLAEDVSERVILTPHGAGYSPYMGERLAREVVTALAAWDEGRSVPHRLV